VKGLPIFAEILGACHETSHVFQHRVGTLRHLVPSALEACNWGRAEGRDDRGQSGKVVETSTFLVGLVVSGWDMTAAI
jgi:hypothetical protein